MMNPPTKLPETAILLANHRIQLDAMSAAPRSETADDHHCSMTSQFTVMKPTLDSAMLMSRTIAMTTKATLIAFLVAADSQTEYGSRPSCPSSLPNQNPKALLHTRTLSLTEQTTALASQCITLDYTGKDGKSNKLNNP